MACFEGVFVEELAAAEDSAKLGEEEAAGVPAACALGRNICRGNGFQGGVVVVDLNGGEMLPIAGGYLIPDGECGFVDGSVVIVVNEELYLSARPELHYVSDVASAHVIVVTIKSCYYHSQASLRHLVTLFGPVYLVKYISLPIVPLAYL